MFRHESTPSLFIKKLLPKSREEFLKIALNYLIFRNTGDGSLCFPEDFNLSDEKLRGINRIVIIACGSAYHAGIVGKSVEVIPFQIYAYYVAYHKGCDIDKPRNLAKSVMVE